MIKIIVAIGIIVIISGAWIFEFINRAPFRIYDSGYVMPTTGASIYWLNDDIILFNGVRNKAAVNMAAPSRWNSIGVLAWNFRTDETSVVVDGSHAFCLEKSNLYISSNIGWGGNWSRRAVGIGPDELIKTVEPPVEISRRIINGQLHCREELIDSYRPDVLENLSAFSGELIRLWDEDVLESEKSNTNNLRFTPVLRSALYPNGKELPELLRMRFISYVEHENSYLVRSSTGRSEAYDNILYQFWLFNEQGMLSRLDVPQEWEQSRLAFKVKNGVVFPELNYSKRRPQNPDQGVFNFPLEGIPFVSQLLLGATFFHAISPDGCKIAFAYSPPLEDNYDYQRNTLTVIDLCIMED